jgi:hypothetical protein
MCVGGLWMSAAERERSYVILQAVDRRLNQREASERLGIGVRQTRRRSRERALPTRDRGPGGTF